MTTTGFTQRLDEFRAQLADYTLTEMGAEPARIFLLRKPEGGAMEGVDIAFLGGPGLGERIIITGDLCPLLHGCVSNIGYGIGWFAGRKSDAYLCEKFLRKVWVPEQALAALKDRLAEEEREERELGDDPVRAQERINAMARIQKLTEAIEEIGGDPSDACAPTRSAEAFCDLWVDIYGDTPEDIGFGYAPRDAALLVAIQEAFARLYEAAQAEKAKPRIGDALTGLAISKSVTLGPRESVGDVVLRRWLHENGYSRAWTVRWSPPDPDTGSPETWWFEIGSPWSGASRTVHTASGFPTRGAACDAADKYIDENFGGRSDETQAGAREGA